MHVNNWLFLVDMITVLEDTRAKANWFLSKFSTFDNEKMRELVPGIEISNLNQAGIIIFLIRAWLSNRQTSNFIWPNDQVLAHGE